MNDSDQYYMLRDIYPEELIKSLDEKDTTDTQQEQEIDKTDNPLITSRLQYYSRDYHELIEKETRSIEKELEHSLETPFDINPSDDGIDSIWNSLYNQKIDNQNPLDDIIKSNLDNYKTFYNENDNYHEKKVCEGLGYQIEGILFDESIPIQPLSIEESLENNPFYIHEIDLYDIMINEIQELNCNPDIIQTQNGWISRNKFDIVTHNLLLEHIDDFTKQKNIELCNVFTIKTDNLQLLRIDQKILKYRNISTFIRMYHEYFMNNNIQVYFFTQKIFSDKYLPIEFKKNKLTKTLKGRKRGSKNKHKKSLDVQSKKKKK